MNRTASRTATLFRRTGLTLTLLLSVPSFDVSAVAAAGSGGLSEPAATYQDCCQDCGVRCQHCNLTLCTVTVPTYVVEKRVKVEVVKEQEEREESSTAFKLVPKTRTYETEQCYLKQEIKSKKITDEKCHLVKMPVERTSNVKTYHPELREVCDPCGTCPPRTCEVMVETTEPQVSVCEETQLAISKTEREISYCVLTPQKRKIPCAEETYYELVPVTKTRKVTVCVPKLVRTPYEVIVCKSIPKNVLCCPECAKKHCK